MSDEEEYAVDFITTARVKKQGRGKAWEYRVRWQGYDEEDDTWEPVKSFNGSEHFVEQFWAKASSLLGDRNVKDMSAFKAGEEFFPPGPLKKRKSLRSLKESSPVASGSNETPKTNKRSRISSSAAVDEPTTKRTRQSANTPSERTSRSKTTASATPASSRRSARKQKEQSIVPPSDEDEEIEFLRLNAASEDSPRSSKRGRSNEATVNTSSTDATVVQQHGDPDPVQHERIPAHRLRTAKPLVQRSDDFEEMDRAISVKSRLTGKAKDDAPTLSNPPSGSAPVRKRRKPGPGRSSEGFQGNKIKSSRSSLLTSEKGQLKSVKGKYVATETITRKEVEVEVEAEAEAEAEAMDVVPVDSEDQPLSALSVEAMIIPTPTSQELLQLAGLKNSDADELQDFEEDEEGTDPIAESSTPSNEHTSLLQQSLSLAKESLFPSSWSAASLGNAVSTAWTKRPTIFGPLGSASDVRPSAHDTGSGSNTQEATQTPPFSLTLDVACYLPVVLTEFSSSDASILDKIVRKATKGPPGKFYSNDGALSILDTFRTGGATARVIPAPNASESETQDFKKLSRRLAQNELFVFMVGVDLLVFCSSDSTLLAQRLNMPVNLVDVPGSVLVERVTIENYSAYANAAMQVDNARW